MGDKLKDMLKKVRQIEIRTNKHVSDALAGAYHSIFKGRGMDFEEAREYQPGDEIRSIDWNVTARTGKAHVKKYREERELTMMIAVDLSASGQFGSGELSKRELAAELAQRGTRHIYLGHLSQENNEPELALAAARSALAECGIRTGRDVFVNVAPRGCSSEVTEL